MSRRALCLLRPRYNALLACCVAGVVIMASGVAYAQYYAQEQQETIRQDTAVLAAPTEGAQQYAPASPLPTYETKKYAILQTLDKVTARTRTVTLPVGTPRAVGPLFIDVKTCQKTPPTETPEAAVFLQVWEAKPKTAQSRQGEPESQWVFSGWMFASSPALSAMNHPIYDVWLKDCSDGKTAGKAPEQN